MCHDAKESITTSTDTHKKKVKGIDLSVLMNRQEYWRRRNEDDLLWIEMQYNID